MKRRKQNHGTIKIYGVSYCLWTAPCPECAYCAFFNPKSEDRVCIPFKHGYDGCGFGRDKKYRVYKKTI